MRKPERLIDHYAAAGVGRDLALRVYTSRLLGGEPELVLHGGGNTSVKTILKDHLGEEVEALCVKGSGWDMADKIASSTLRNSVSRGRPKRFTAGMCGAISAHSASVRSLA
jgi:hypothetical protein